MSQLNSKKWLKEHFNCPYVKQAKQEGYKSRAVYKLKEIQHKTSLLSKDTYVLELGAAPGSWTQYITEIVSTDVIAVDVLPFEAMPKVTQIVGDFAHETIQNQLIDLAKIQKFDVILSDMLPNCTGHATVDHLKSASLVEHIIWLIPDLIAKNGALLVKILQGSELFDIVKLLREKFNKVQLLKPKASRARSNEVFVYASGYKGEKS